MIKIVSDKAPKVDIQSILTAEEITAIHEFMHHYPHARAASLDALKVVQKRNGWVDDAQVNAVANMLDVPVTDVEGVATFFNRIYRSPVGRHVILICDSVACYLTGYEALSAELQKQLGIGYGQTTPDGRFTILPICCLGNCDKGPAVLIDEDTYGPVTPAEVTQLLELYP
ncbi:NADH-quinone oxidoreductase subunit NuoE [Psychrobacter arenosus]